MYISKHLSLQPLSCPAWRTVASGPEPAGCCSSPTRSDQGSQLAESKGSAYTKPWLQKLGELLSAMSQGGMALKTLGFTESFNSEPSEEELPDALMVHSGSGLGGVLHPIGALLEVLYFQRRTDESSA